MRACEAYTVEQAHAHLSRLGWKKKKRRRRIKLRSRVAPKLIWKANGVSAYERRISASSCCTCRVNTMLIFFSFLTPKKQHFQGGYFSLLSQALVNSIIVCFWGTRWLCVKKKNEIKLLAPTNCLLRFSFFSLLFLLVQVHKNYKWLSFFFLPP